jgi:potassium efflux system protein
MRCSLPKLFQTALLLALSLLPGRVAAQDPQGGQSPAPATGHPVPVPELADLIPLTTALSDRLAGLERTIPDTGDLSQVQQQLGEIVPRIDAVARQFLALKASRDRRAGRPARLRAEIESAGDALTEVSNAVTAKVRTFGNLRRHWLAEQKRWNAWQAALSKDEPLKEITTTVTKAQGVIDTALALLRQQLEPLLALQEQVGTLRTRFNTLTAEVDGLLPSSPSGVLADASPAMFSARYVSQLATAVEAGVPVSLVQISWPARLFLAREGWVVVLQGVLSLLLGVALVRHRRRLEAIEHWRFVAARPFSAGLLVGLPSGVALYEGLLPDVVRLVLSVLVGTAFVRLLGGVVKGGWRRHFLYGLVTLSILTNIGYVLGVPLALFRLYVLVAALVSLLCCLRWAAQSRRLGQARVYAWALRLAAALFAAVLFAEVRGQARLADFLFVSSLRTLGIVLVFALFRRLLRGGLEWAVLSRAARRAAPGGGNAAAVVQRVTLLFDVLIGVVIVSILLTTWHVYESAAQAISGLLSVHVAIGSQRITLGYVIGAVGALVVSYFVSTILQTTLTERVLARRNVDRGVSISVTRLLHYAVVSVGFVIALLVLGVDLTKLTLLASALGVGIGFGLQTIVNNFVCGLILLFERPLRVGDTIEFDGQWVKIAKIGLRSTRVRTFDQADVIVPNTALITNQVTNWTLTDRHARELVAVGVAYGSDVTLVMQTLKECALSHPGVMKSPEPQVLFRSFGDSALDFELRAWVADVDTRLQVASDLNQAIDRRFREAGIVIPFPQRDLHVHSVAQTDNAAATGVSAPVA